MTWSIQLNWNGEWVNLADGFQSRGDAEWSIGLWKQKHGVTSDPFRAVQDTPTVETRRLNDGTEVVKASAMQRSIVVNMADASLAEAEDAL